LVVFDAVKVIDEFLPTVLRAVTVLRVGAADEHLLFADRPFLDTLPFLGVEDALRSLRICQVVIEYLVEIKVVEQTLLVL
ncbi:hypothetical protein, partial [Klebsiella pneumoniae]|uniref:hypothetical protein n=1 Tax=Klebsiella pneumoniae TaxID=573 RepID=UPI0022B71734